MNHLTFGYNQGLPVPPATAAWGCRAIVDQGGNVDVVWDRTSTYGPDEAFNALAARLDAGAGSQWRQRASELLTSGEMSTREDREHVLVNDHGIVVKGNTYGSAGYLYVCAYLAEDGSSS